MLNFTQNYEIYYSNPLVLGKEFKLLISLLTANWIDLAKALKIDSILWCSFSPSALIFKLHLAPSEKDLKKWLNISVGISPIFSLLNSAFQTSQFLPEKSKATWAKQSSMGNKKPYLAIPFFSCFELLNQFSQWSQLLLFDQFKFIYN